jgi:hypothetical protein
MQRLPGGRQPCAGLEPVEQPFAQLTLELADLLAQRRLGHMALFRRPGKIAGPCDRDQVAQLLELHR